MVRGVVSSRSGSSIHSRLYEFVKATLIKIFVQPYATVCDLYCGRGYDSEKWDEAQIGHYIGMDVTTSGIKEFREVWESQRKSFTSDFFEIDLCTENIGVYLKGSHRAADVVCCLQHLQLCFGTEARARKFLFNVACLLRPGGYFFGITPDSSTIWAKYQKNVEAYHNRSSGLMKPSIVPNCIGSENYMINFEVEEEKFPLFGKKYQLRFANDMSIETHCLVHFPSLIRLAREVGLEYVEIQNLTEFYDDNRAHFASVLQNYGPNLIDHRGKLLSRSYDILGLYTTFVFQRPDPDAALPIPTPPPLMPNESHTIDERKGRGGGNAERPQGLANIAEQKGILGPGPPDLRFSEAF